MNEKKFDRWIGILSISVIALVAIVFVSITSNVHLAKGTYGVSNTKCTCDSGWTPTANKQCVKETTGTVTCRQGVVGGQIKNECAGYDNCTLISGNAQGGIFKCSKTEQVVKDANCTTSWTPSCYISNGKYIWATSQSEAAGNSVSLSQSECVGCIDGYHVSGSTCVKNENSCEGIPYPGDAYFNCTCKLEAGALAAGWECGCSYKSDEDCREKTGQICTSKKYKQNALTSFTCYYPTGGSETIHCDNGTYLPEGQQSCAQCPNNSCCQGGDFLYSTNGNQGITNGPCPSDDPGTTTPPNPGNPGGSYTPGNSGWPSGYSCSGYCGGTITCNYDTTGYKCNSNGNDYNYVCFKEGNMYKCDPALCTGMCGGTLTCNYDTSGYKCDHSGTTYYYHSCTKNGNTYTCSPSTNPSVNGPSTNPQTGTTAIIFVWIIGVASLVYSVWYFTRKNKNYNH